MKNCLECNELLYKTAKQPVCLSCRSKSVCSCGTKKDWRAERCRSCASTIGTKEQWVRIRPKMIQTMTKAGVRRRRKFDDLKWIHFRETKTDGRKFARYTDEQGKLRAIHRYQWVWIQHNGPIPKGYVIHHKDLNATNDSIGNLQCLTQSDHMKLHREMERHERRLFAASPVSPRHLNSSAVTRSL